MKLNIFIDGACRGNPGPSSIGVLIQDERGSTLKEHHRFIGEHTNNVAEYTALLDALKLAKTLGGTKLHIRSDSQLLVRQFSGQYKVKNARLLGFLIEIQGLRREFLSVDLVHIPREQNTSADALANAALDQR